MCHKEIDKLSSDGIIKELGDLSPGTVVTESALSKIFKRSPTTIKRAVDRGELPPPIRIFGQCSWTIEAIQQHFRKEHERLKNEREELEKRLRNTVH